MKALYPGSFDMFTYGHLSVLKQAASIFDEVVVCISQNPAKKRRYPIENCKKAIEATIKYLGIENVSIISTDCTIPAKIAVDNNCDFIVRGIRNTSDYLYEDQLAAFNTAYSSLVKTIYFRAENSEISSTMVKSFIDIGEYYKAQTYLPYDIKLILSEDSL